MLRIAAIGLIGVLAAAASAQALMVFAHEQTDSQLRPAQQAMTAVTETSATTTAGGSAAELVKSPDGHFWADATVNGQAVRLLVDTGATAVALTADDARRLGYDPAALTYAYQVSTANGPARAARITLGSVSVAGAEVNGVDALVIDKGLQTSLLGMTYLGRLSQFEATPTSLILRP